MILALWNSMIKSKKKLIASNNPFESVKMSENTITSLEKSILKCFNGSAGSHWYGGTEGKIGDDANKLYVAIVEDNDWWKNKCVLQDWYFDYDAFKSLNVNMDCQSYGVYCFWLK